MVIFFDIDDTLIDHTAAVRAAALVLHASALRLLLKDDRASDSITVDVFEPDHDDPFVGIRCPLCKWRPSLSSRWCCNCGGTPEPFFEGCGMVWNTFSTQGRCPGCSHQWQWTSCLRCGMSSLHKDWYEAWGV